MYAFSLTHADALLFEKYDPISLSKLLSLALISAIFCCLGEILVRTLFSSSFDCGDSLASSHQEKP
jgi:H+/Cl- antiporter ClcA